ncbi:hypothetical protein JRO89_XS06G0010100 [Xanthoceras sorbifolium]|uniref:Uncharacterized protein n=1 Tax=Xanthoceras sorbifolium TaxID=99658 RepID=A0ABQ8HVX6_9ROSI|nr:hypothetical protein JRO89_XS06G0010100 [Xanthoceras sorbifolium]
MSQVRTFSSPELAPTSSTSHTTNRPEDFSLEGIATNVKLLLKLIHDHAEASNRDLDDRKTQRVAGMMTILDDVKTRIQKSQALKNRKAELRRCNTDLRPNRAPREKKPAEPVTDEKERLRRQLYASLAARKSLEIMCSSVGKEKEIIASELARKVQELNGTEELINDLKVQNESLLGKLQHCASEHKEKRPSSSGGEIQGNAALQERNQALSEQLLRSLDGYRSLKRKYKDAQVENIMMRATMEEMGKEVEAGLQQISGFRQRLATREEQPLDVEAEISALERMFESFKMKLSNHTHKKSDCATKLNTQINSSKPSVLV